jgi:hypothetical protein
MWRKTARTASASLRVFRDRVRLALQKALVGQVTPEMRLVSVESDSETVRVVVYFDRNLDEADREEFAAEVAACLGLDLGDPPAGPVAQCHFVRCDEPQVVPVRGEIVFSRKGVRAF